MKHSFLISFIAFNYITANSTQKSFLEFNEETLKGVEKVSCLNPKFYIDMANIEESKPENQDKIILYHGESYGAWLFQLILKGFMFPEANEDWLPLRYKELEKDIDRTDLMKMISNFHIDHEKAYKELAISVNANLVSQKMGESAWYIICERQIENWHKLSGLSLCPGDKSLHSSLLKTLKKEYISENQWEHFKRQKKLLYHFIQVKRGLCQHHDSSLLLNEVQKLYPYTFTRFQSHFESLPLVLENYKNRKKDYYEGVALQFIMDQELADMLTYYSHPFGFVRSTKHAKYKNRIPWEGEEIEPYSEFYKEEKNKEDFRQARLAMNNDFRSFPSRVRIKSIAGIMEDPVDYEILKSMIKELVEVNKIKK